MPNESREDTPSPPAVFLLSGIEFAILGSTQNTTSIQNPSTLEQPGGEMNGPTEKSRNTLPLLLLFGVGLLLAIAILVMPTPPGETPTPVVREFKYFARPSLESKFDELRYNIEHSNRARLIAAWDELRKTASYSTWQDAFEAAGYDFPAGTYVEGIPNGITPGFWRICHEPATLDRIEKQLKLERR